MYDLTLVKEIFVVVIHPEGGFIDPRESERRVFVCGSLMDPGFVKGIIGRAPAVCPAVAEGFSRGWGESGGKPMHFLQRDPAGMVPGVAILGLSADELAGIEKFEQAPSVRKKVELILRIGDVELPGQTYLKKD